MIDLKLEKAANKDAIKRRRAEKRAQAKRVVSPKPKLKVSGIGGTIPGLFDRPQHSVNPQGVEQTANDVLASSGLAPAQSPAFDQPFKPNEAELNAAAALGSIKRKDDLPAVINDLGEAPVAMEVAGQAEMAMCEPGSSFRQVTSQLRSYADGVHALARGGMEIHEPVRARAGLTR